MMDGKSVVEKFNTAKKERVNHDSNWDEVCNYVWPRHAEFTAKISSGQKTQTQYMIGGVLELIDQAVNMIVGLTAPEGERWHGIITGDPGIDNNDLFQNWAADVSNIIFPMRYDVYSNFHEAFKNTVKSNLLFGNAAGYPVDPDFSGNIVYQNIPLSRIWVTLDAYGRVDGYFMCQKYTAKQILDKYSGAGDTLSGETMAALDKNSENKHDIVTYIAKRNAPALSKDTLKNKMWLSHHVFLDTENVMRVEGFDKNPIMFTRTDVAPSDTYGTGLVERIMPEVKLYDQVQKSLAKALPLAALGLILAKDDYVGFGQKAAPGAMIAGGLDSEGRRGIEWMFPQGRVDWGMSYGDAIRDNIARRLTIQLLEIVAEKPNMTATEILQRAQERGMMLAPLLSVNMRFLAMQTEREIDLLEQAGVLPPRPAILINRGKPLRVRFESPASNLIQQQDVRKLSEYTQVLSVLAQVSPETVQKASANINVERLNDYIKDALGIDNRIFLNEDEMEKRKEEEQAMQAAQLSIQGLPELARAQKDLAQAQQISGAL